MEVLPTPDLGPSGPLSEDPGPTGEPDLSERLAGLESRIDGLCERLGRLESSLRAAVAEEVQGATAELRRAISELGRRLVLDLPHELARHRDAIVAELRPPPPPPPALEDQPPAAGPEPEPVVEAPPAVVADPPEAAERRRDSRRRRRHG